VARGGDALGLSVAIASSSPLAWVEGHLARLGLTERFAVLVCRGGLATAAGVPRTRLTPTSSSFVPRH
jgi:beta-phosphoglucomutase-like phosphatase (HAD superfamily)